MLGSASYNFSKFRDQLVHDVIVEVPYTENPKNTKFSPENKYKDEISEFSQLVSEADHSEKMNLNNTVDKDDL